MDFKEQSKLPHIVVLGAGFGGLRFCRRFHGPARVTLVDQHNYHLFQPLLYQVATAGLSAVDIAHPTRSIFRSRENIETLMASVKDIDLSARQVRTDRLTLDYDYLVLAMGGVSSFFGHVDWARHVLPLKTLEDAMAIRRQILLNFERAETTRDPREQTTLTTIVIVGGGPTGVELAGAVIELTRRVFRKDFRHLNPQQARTILIDGNDALLKRYPSKLSQHAMNDLRGMGVKLMLGQHVTDIQHNTITVGNETIASANILWAAGVAGNPVAGRLGVALKDHGRIVVEPDLSIPGHPEVFVLGDMAAATNPDGSDVPNLAPAAMQMGEHVADLIGHAITQPEKPRPRKPFTYHDHGTMATIGRSRAVANLGWIHLTGFPAWITWLFTHLLFLIGFRNKVLVLIHWWWAYLMFKPGARVIVGADNETTHEGA